MEPGEYRTQAELDKLFEFFARLTAAERIAAKVCRSVGLSPFMAMDFLKAERIKRGEAPE
jgi:hypothetical protein